MELAQAEAVADQGVAAVEASRMKRDEIETKARALARAQVHKVIKKAGHKISDFPYEDITKAVGRLMKLRGKELRALAKKR